MTKAFITGITGMVGSHLLDYLLDNTNWKIYGLIRWRSSLDNVSHVISSKKKYKRVTFLYGDLNDILSLRKAVKLSKPDYVFHLAAESFPKTSFDSPLSTYNTNILGTVNLLEVLRSEKIDPLIHVCSSSEIFGRVKKEQLPINEDCNFHPASPYAISKIGTDLVARFHSEAYGQKILSTRMFTHTGPRRGDVFAESSFAKQIAMIENNLQEPIVYTGNLKSMRTYADVRDAVRAYYMLLTVKPKSGEYYNIGGSFSCEVGDMLNYLISLSKVKKIKIKVSKDRLRPIDADLQIPDCRKFAKHTGWKPKIRFEDTMRDLLNYWRIQIKSGKQFLNR